jgi:hypothetical protein
LSQFCFLGESAAVPKPHHQRHSLWAKAAAAKVVEVDVAKATLECGQQQQKTNREAEDPMRLPAASNLTKITQLDWQRLGPLHVSKFVLFRFHQPSTNSERNRVWDKTIN